MLKGRSEAPGRRLRTCSGAWHAPLAWRSIAYVGNFILLIILIVRVLLDMPLHFLHRKTRWQIRAAPFLKILNDIFPCYFELKAVWKSPALNFADTAYGETSYCTALQNQGIIHLSMGGSSAPARLLAWAVLK